MTAVRLVPVGDVSFGNPVSVVGDRFVSSEVPGAPQTVSAETTLTFADHKTPTDVEAVSSSLPWAYNGVASGIPVQLIFWTDYWDPRSGPGGAQGLALVERVEALLASPYTSHLAQYYVAPPVSNGEPVYVYDWPLPDHDFDGGDIADLIWHLIDDWERFPEPDDGGYIAYMVMMPERLKPSDPSNPSGAHFFRPHWELGVWPPVEIEFVWGAWIGWGSLDQMTVNFAHELVELVTDPQDSTWFAQSIGHKDGEIADLCQPHGNQTAFVGDVMVPAYWSVQEQSCVIPTYPFKARLDGAIALTNELPAGSGQVETGPGAHKELCALLPACCMKGPYQWTRTQRVERVTLEGSSIGYHNPVWRWTVAGVDVPGSETVKVQASVAIDAPTGTTIVDQLVSLTCTVNGKFLEITNDSVVGNFSVSVTATCVDADAPGSHGSERPATVSVPFIGSEFTWSANYLDDVRRCQDAADWLWKETHKKVQSTGIPNPGPIHETDLARLRDLPAWATEEQQRALTSVLLLTRGLQGQHRAEAKQLRRLFTSALGLPTSLGKSATRAH